MPFYRGVYGCIPAGGKYFLQDITIYEASCILCHLAVCQLLIMNANLADSAVNPVKCLSICVKRGKKSLTNGTTVQYLSLH